MFGWWENKCSPPPKKFCQLRVNSLAEHAPTKLLTLQKRQNMKWKTCFLVQKKNGFLAVSETFQMAWNIQKCKNKAKVWGRGKKHMAAKNKNEKMFSKLHEMVRNHIFLFGDVWGEGGVSRKQKWKQKKFLSFVGKFFTLLSGFSLWCQKSVTFWCPKRTLLPNLVWVKANSQTWNLIFSKEIPRKIILDEIFEVLIWEA